MNPSHKTQGCQRVVTKTILWQPKSVVIIDREALAKQGDNALGSVRPSVRLFVCLSVCNPKSAAKKSHYQS